LEGDTLIVVKTLLEACLPPVDERGDLLWLLKDENANNNKNNNNNNKAIIRAGRAPLAAKKGRGLGKLNEKQFNYYIKVLTKFW
jgi:hypothetical protein